MPRIPLSHAQAGQKLARSVTNAGGMVMMQTGTVLTAALIERLDDIGVETIVVAGDEGGEGQAPEAVQRAFDELFMGHEQDAWMMELKSIVVRQALDGGRDA